MRISAVYDRSHPVPPGVRPSYWELRSIWVADSLDDLIGPSTGTVERSPHIEWSTRREVNLDDPMEIASWYASILMEAISDDDLTLMNREVLVRIWPELFLPARVRWTWKSRFQELD